jgi:hypothetical protein
MRGLVEQLRLAEKAAEDIYFAKVNRELIESLHQRMRAEAQCLATSGSIVEARAGTRPAVVKQASGD